MICLLLLNFILLYFRFFKSFFNMQNLFILLFTAAVCYGTFTKTEDGYNICVYSKDPKQYEPKCFPCPAVVYINSLLACVNGTSTMPSNITYASANCMEKNCAINYPKPSTPPPLNFNVSSSFYENIAKLFHLRLARSTDDNKMQDSSEQSTAGRELDSSGFRIIGQIETFAADTDFTELEFSESIKQFE